MAELNLGAFEMARRARSGECPHTQVLSVTSTGVERSICENCGYISVTFTKEVSGPVDRRLFARKADREAGSGPAYPFAIQPSIGLTRRSVSHGLPDFAMSA